MPEIEKTNQQPIEHEEPAMGDTGNFAKSQTSKTQPRIGKKNLKKAVKKALAAQKALEYAILQIVDEMFKDDSEELLNENEIDGNSLSSSASSCSENSVQGAFKHKGYPDREWFMDYPGITRRREEDPRLQLPGMFSNPWMFRRGMWGCGRGRGRGMGCRGMMGR